MYSMCENELPVSGLSNVIIITTRECMHLVTCGHFRSCDKDGSHTIRSTITENLMLHEDLLIEVVHYGIFDFFATVTLT